MLSTNFEPIAAQLLSRLNRLRTKQQKVQFLAETISITPLYQRLLFDERLTSSEVACLYWAMQGKRTQETAKLLGVSQQTVKNYQHAILRKLHCSTIEQAVFRAIQLGVIQPGKFH